MRGIALAVFLAACVQTYTGPSQLELECESFQMSWCGLIAECRPAAYFDHCHSGNFTACMNAHSSEPPTIRELMLACGEESSDWTCEQMNAGGTTNLPPACADLLAALSDEAA